MIKTENLSKHIIDSSGKLEILSHVNISIKKGESAAIVGASGSGKSTLLGLVAGLDLPSEGAVYLAGQDIFALSEDERAAYRGSLVGFVFQNFQLLPNLTALENVMLPLELMQDPQPKEKAKQMLERVGLGQRLYHYPKLMSGGEQQRVALARAFVVKPQILLADEPTGSLDFASGKNVMDLIMELNQEQGTTLVLVTHDLKLAQQCHQQIKIENGQVV